MVLRYDDPVASPGKAGDGSDVVEARFVELVPGEHVPPGISAAEHAVGLASSLQNLAAHLER